MAEQPRDQRPRPKTPLASGLPHYGIGGDRRGRDPADPPTYQRPVSTDHRHHRTDRSDLRSPRPERLPRMFHRRAARIPRDGADHRYREVPSGVRRTSVDGRPDGPPSDLPEYASVPVTARDPKRREAFRRVAWLTSPGSTVQRARRFPERTRAPNLQRDGGRPRPETWSRRVSRRVRPSADKTRWRSPACAATNVDRATRNRFLVEVR